MGASPYHFRSGFNAGISFCEDVRPAGYPRDLLAQAIAEGKRIRKYYAGDFYTLSDVTTSPEAWCVLQYDRPAAKDGMVMAFRRQASPDAVYVCALKGIDPGGRVRRDRFARIHAGTRRPYERHGPSSLSGGDPRGAGLACRRIPACAVRPSLVGGEQEARKTVCDGTKPASAQEILQRMAEVYGTCDSYCDSGVVETVYHSEDGQRVTRKPFTTAFVRHDRYRFEFRHRHGEDLPWRRNVVWTNGRKTRTLWDIDLSLRTVWSVSKKVPFKQRWGMRAGCVLTRVMMQAVEWLPAKWTNEALTSSSGVSGRFSAYRSSSAHAGETEGIPAERPAEREAPR